MNTSIAKDTWTKLLEDPEVCEIGGEHTNEGIDYARYLAMALLVEMEEKDLPTYALIFEYLQDIAILDSPTAPTRATLIQVKKKSKGVWSKSALCNKERTKGKGTEAPSQEEPPSTEKAPPAKKLGAKSPLGKLYLCVDKLAEQIPTDGLFVSNAGNDLKLNSGNAAPANTKVSFSHLHSEDFEYINKKLLSELKRKSLSHLALLAVEQSKIIPASMREAVRGLLDELLHKRYPTLPSISGRLQEKLLSIFSECSSPSGPMESLEQVLEKKGFTRDDFTNLIAEFASTRSATDHLDVVIQGLKSDGMASRLADKLRTDANRLQIQLVRSPQTKEAVLWEIAVSAARSNSTMPNYLYLLDAVTQAVLAESKVRRKGPTTEQDANPVSLLAIIYVDQESPTLSA